MAPAAQRTTSGVREGRNKKVSNNIPSSRVLRCRAKSKCKQPGAVKKLCSCNFYEELDNYARNKSATPTPNRRRKTAKKLIKSLNTDNSIKALGSSNKRPEKVYSVLKIKKRWCLMFEKSTDSRMDKENVLINHIWRCGFHKKFRYQYIY
ncbi:uncharacterized protein [Chelonus insularis]|uniref:uncharacterized protein n=1 Tax=Chelonus insularis TaxID=460826 RepID=UPI00158AF5BD|nr:uncharacterized protein LOC118064730 [Chelonus insularis]